MKDISGKATDLHLAGFISNGGQRTTISTSLELVCLLPTPFSV